MYVYSFIDSKQPLYDCASLKMTLFLTKKKILILFTFQNLKILHFNKTHTLISESLVSQNIEKYTFPYF